MLIFLLSLINSIAPSFAFVYTTALRKIIALKKRIHVIQGGSSAGKTFAILPIMIDKCCKRGGLEMSVVAESIPHLKRGALKDFKKIMKSTGRWRDKNYNATDRKYTFTNGSFIEFFSPESILGARRTHLFINEANAISFEDYHQLAIRTSEEIWIDYNPAQEFWAHKELIPDPDADFIILTYKDNEALSESLVREIEKARDKAPFDSYFANWWKVYGLGLVGTLEGVIFGNFKSINDFPLECDWIAYGLDFGFTNDPTTLVKVGMKAGQIYLEQKIFKTGMLNSDIIKELKAIGIKDEEIIADSADPKSIREIRNAGFNIQGAEKGGDSVVTGLGLMKQYDYNITSASLDLIKEWRGCSWKKNMATNKWMNEPVDKLNHTIDAIRYCITYKLSGGKGNIVAYGALGTKGSAGKEIVQDYSINNPDYKKLTHEEREEAYYKSLQDEED